MGTDVGNLYFGPFIKMHSSQKRQYEFALQKIAYFFLKLLKPGNLIMSLPQPFIFLCKGTLSPFDASYWKPVFFFSELINMQILV